MNRRHACSRRIQRPCQLSRSAPAKVAPTAEVMDLFWQNSKPISKPEVSLESITFTPLLVLTERIAWIKLDKFVQFRA